MARPDKDKALYFLGSSQADLTAFPDDAKRVAGFQLRKVQKGLNPDHWRAMPQVGAGVAEIRITTDDAYRVFYVVKSQDAVFVLHAFQKTSEQTSKRDLELGRKRYRALEAALAAERAKAKKDRT